MSIKIVKGNYSSVMDSASLTGNRTITLPNSTGTVALTNQLSKVATSNNYNDLSNRPALKTVATSGSYNDLSNRPALKPVATTGSYNDLTNKPTIPATPQGYITQTWHSGANWYRVWSDGFIEQGGFNTGTTNGAGAEITVQLHKTYSNTQYHISKNSIWFWNGAISGCYVNFWSITTFSAKTQDINTGGKHGFSWYACRY